MKLILVICLCLATQGSFAANLKKDSSRNPASFCGSSTLATALAEADQILVSGYQQGSDEERNASQLTFCLMALTENSNKATFEKIMKKVKALNHQYCQVHGASC
ncbi:MAG: hypothetical protein ACXWQJ_15020 [Bdellovibrionota bacterium]